LPARAALLQPQRRESPTRPTAALSLRKAAKLFAGITPDPAYRPISLGIGEPKHPTPEFIKRALTDNLAGLASYPATRAATPCAARSPTGCRSRYGIPRPDPATEVLPVNGSREALFSLRRP
jgi:N-succinyldiaminopimelate aminotransferase